MNKKFTNFITWQEKLFGLYVKYLKFNLIKYGIYFKWNVNYIDFKNAREGFNNLQIDFLKKNILNIITTKNKNKYENILLNKSDKFYKNILFSLLTQNDIKMTFEISNHLYIGFNKKEIKSHKDFEKYLDLENNFYLKNYDLLTTKKIYENLTEILKIFNLTYQDINFIILERTTTYQSKLDFKEEYWVNYFSSYYFGLNQTRDGK